MAQLAIIPKTQSANVCFRQIPVVDVKSDGINDSVEVCDITEKSCFSQIPKSTQSQSYSPPLKVQGPQVLGVWRQVGELVPDTLSQHGACPCLC